MGPDQHHENTDGVFQRACVDPEMGVRYHLIARLEALEHCDRTLFLAFLVTYSVPPHHMHSCSAAGPRKSVVITKDILPVLHKPSTHLRPHAEQASEQPNWTEPTSKCAEHLDNPEPLGQRYVFKSFRASQDAAQCFQGLISQQVDVLGVEVISLKLQRLALSSGTVIGGSARNARTAVTDHSEVLLGHRECQEWSSWEMMTVEF